MYDFEAFDLNPNANAGTAALPVPQFRVVEPDVPLHLEPVRVERQLVEELRAAELRQRINSAEVRVPVAPVVILVVGVLHVEPTVARVLRNMAQVLAVVPRVVVHDYIVRVPVEERCYRRLQLQWPEGNPLLPYCR